MDFKNHTGEYDGCFVGTLLEQNATSRPDDVFAVFEDGELWTYKRCLDLVRATANVFFCAGIKKGDHVAIFLPNGAEFILASWGASLLGAVTVPINTSYRGHVLAHLIELSKPKAIVIGDEFTDRLEGCEFLKNQMLRIGSRDLRGNNYTSPKIDGGIRIWDTQSLIMTSGTTGPSKLATVSFLQTFVGGAGFIVREGLGPNDTFQLDLPLFHMSAQYFSTACLYTGTRLAVRTRPSLDTYWEVARDNGATCGVLLSTMVPYLLSKPPREAEREHQMRTLMATPLPSDIEGFKRRFGVERLVVMYGSTEVPGCTVGDDRDELGLGYSGEVRAPFEVRLVDENDIEVPDGKPGEAIVRSSIPWALSNGYLGDPAETARAWRNGWFHTGDVLRKDSRGRYFFVDRAKDALRRRGEMVAAHEVEVVLRAFVGIAEAAVVAYPADSGVDDEVKAWLVAADGHSVNFAELLHFCAAQLPHFMVPRYFELTEAFPKTASLRVQKFELRERGNGAEVWDAVAHGFSVTRRGVQARAM